MIKSSDLKNRFLLYNLVPRAFLPGYAREKALGTLVYIKIYGPF